MKLFWPAFVLLLVIGCKNPLPTNALGENPILSGAARGWKVPENRFDWEARAEVRNAPANESAVIARGHIFISEFSLTLPGGDTVKPYLLAAKTVLGLGEVPKNCIGDIRINPESLRLAKALIRFYDPTYEKRLKVAALESMDEFNRLLKESDSKPLIYADPENPDSISADYFYADQDGEITGSIGCPSAEASKEASGVVRLEIGLKKGWNLLVYETKKDTSGGLNVLATSKPPVTTLGWVISEKLLMP